MKNIVILIYLLSIGSTTLQSQDIFGHVTDVDNNPLQYAIAYSGQNHSHTDENGNFRLMNISPGDTLRIEYLGFEDYQKIVEPGDLDNEVVIILQSKLFKMEAVTISKSVKTTNTIASIDIQVNPVNSSQEVLRRVPGLLIGQHAGGGKAEQIFLRGFDIDHGTDITLNVDGVPVNMVSHAHGQGYSDLHFIIPETIDNIDFGKGPYYTEIGNFNTAGYVNFKTKDKLDGSLVAFDYGRFDTGRILGMFDLLESSENQSAYIATEYQQSNGPVESPQNFSRLNLMGKYGIETEGGDLLNILVSRMHSNWNASGQIPQRLVDNGTITRFGSVDDTEGGTTSRTNIALNHSKAISDKAFVKTAAFYTAYDFELFSNFTFFLEDPVNGDQIRQTENRQIYGVNSTLFQTIDLESSSLEVNVNGGFRYDLVDDVELSKTLNRKTTLSTLSKGNVNELNGFTGVDLSWDINNWLFNAGLRLDYFNFNYSNTLSSTYDNQSIDKVRLSPKFNVIYSPTNRLQYYFKSGIGFHSNDSRVVTGGTADVDLPAAYGADLGIVFKPIPKLIINSALWYLFLEQEFVYVGDAGIVEPSGRTVRQGIDLSLRYQLGRNLFINGDVTYTDANAIDEPEGLHYIPLSVQWMTAGGLSIKDYRGFSFGVRYRYITDRPANEDNSIVALGYFITDVNASYLLNKVTLGLTIENLFNTEWNEAQFATQSRLFDESVAVEELHFTPGVPFFLKGSVSYRF